MMRKGKTLKVVLFVFSIICLLPLQVQAESDTDPFITDLNDLVAQGDELVEEMNTTFFTSTNMSSSLVQIEEDVASYRRNLFDMYNTIEAYSEASDLTSDSLMALQDLSIIHYSLGMGMLGLSTNMFFVAPFTSLEILEDSIEAMLLLADDIGEMADRILEMADKIGEMADRIIETQVIQSENLELIIDAIMETQENMLSLIEMFLT